MQAGTRSQTKTAPKSNQAPAPTPIPDDVPRTLEELLDLPADRLRALYEGARVPPLADLEGDLRGRMLAVPSLPGVAAKVTATLARSDLFPWRGKSFQGQGEQGEGVNRVIADRLRVFRFTTTIGKSRAGDFDAVQLDYDRPGNPFFIRAIKDEVRELRPGLYLGQAYVVAGGKETLGLYFGLAR
jgi:hypothetical protein